MATPCKTCRAPAFLKTEFNVRRSHDIKRGVLNLRNSAVRHRVRRCSNDTCAKLANHTCKHEHCAYGRGPFLAKPDEKQEDWERAAICHGGRLYHAACVLRCDGCGQAGVRSMNLFTTACSENGEPHEMCRACEIRCVGECAKPCRSTGCMNDVPAEQAPRMHASCLKRLSDEELPPPKKVK